MNDINDHNASSPTLDEQIAALTEWPADAEPQVWKDALHIAKNRHGRSGSLGVRVLAWPLPRSVAAVLVVVLIGLALAKLLLPSIGRARNVSSMAEYAQAPNPSADVNGDAWKREYAFGTGETARDGEAWRSDGYRGGGGATFRTKKGEVDETAAAVAGRPNPPTIEMAFQGA